MKLQHIVRSKNPEKVPYFVPQIWGGCCRQDFLNCLSRVHIRPQVAFMYGGAAVVLFFVSGPGYSYSFRGVRVPH